MHIYGESSSSCIFIILPHPVVPSPDLEYGLPHTLFLFLFVACTSSSTVRFTFPAR